MQTNKKFKIKALFLVFISLSVPLFISNWSHNNSKNKFHDLRDEKILIVGQIDPQIRNLLIKELGEDKYPLFYNRLTAWGTALQESTISNLSLRESVLISGLLHDFFKNNYSSQNRTKANFMKSPLNSDEWFARIEGRHSYADISCMIHKFGDECSIFILIHEHAL